MENAESLKLKYLSLYPKHSCLIHDCNPPVSDSIEGFDFVRGQVICERVGWDPSIIQLVLNDIKNISVDDLTRLANLFLNKNDSGDTLSYCIRDIKSREIIDKYERFHLQYEDGTYFFIYHDGSGFGFIKDPNDFPIKTKFHPNECLVVYDYLRSMGYALPYLNFSVRQLIDLGWLCLR